MMSIATERVSWLIIGLVMFFGGVYLAYLLGASVGGPFANFYDRATVWLDPFAQENYDRIGGSYQGKKEPNDGKANLRPAT